MLAAALLTCLAQETTSWGQDLGRTPIPSEQEELVTRLRTMPISELLPLQPGPVRIKRDGQWIVRAEVMEMQRRVEAGALSSDDWRAALTDTNLIFTRSRWPVRMPLQVGIGYQAWLPLAKITVRAVEPDIGEVTFDNRRPSHCGTCQEFRYEDARHLAMGPLPEGSKRVVFEVSVLQRENSDRPTSRTEHDRLLWQGRLERQIEAVASTADMLPASTADADRDAIRSCLHASWSRVPEQADDLYISLYGRYEDVPALRGLGVALSIELWNDTSLVRSGDIVAYSRPSITGEFDESAGLLAMKGLPEVMRAEDFDPSKWELRVRTNPAGIPGIWEADRWWNGNFSIPLSGLLKKSEAK